MDDAYIRMTGRMLLTQARIARFQRAVDDFRGDDRYVAGNFLVDVSELFRVADLPRVVEPLIAKLPEASKRAELGREYAKQRRLDRSKDTLRGLGMGRVNDAFGMFQLASSISNKTNSKLKGGRLEKGGSVDCGGGVTGAVPSGIGRSGGRTGGGDVGAAAAGKDICKKRMPFEVALYDRYRHHRVARARGRKNHVFALRALFLVLPLAAVWGTLAVEAAFTPRTRAELQGDGTAYGGAERAAQAQALLQKLEY